MSAKRKAKEEPVVELRFRMGVRAFRQFASSDGLAVDHVWLVEEAPGVWSLVTFGSPNGWSRTRNPMKLVARLPKRGEGAA